MTRLLTAGLGFLSLAVSTTSFAGGSTAPATQASIGVAAWGNSAIRNSAELPNLMRLLSRARGSTTTQAGKIDFLGDSQTCGYELLNASPSASTVTGNPVARMAAALNVRGVITRADYMGPNFGGGAAGYSLDPRVTLGSGWTAVGHSGGGINDFENTTTTTTLSFAPTNSVTGFNFWYSQYFGASWTYNIDGGSNTTVTYSSNQSGSGIQKITIAGLTEGTHTLNITRVSGIPYIIGVDPFDANASAAREVNICSGGQTTSSYIQSTTSLYMGAIWPAMVNSGDVVVIALGVNDFNTGSPYAQIQANLQTLIAQVQAKGADVIVTSQIPFYSYTSPNSAYAGMTLLQQNTQLMQTYAAAAAAMGVPFLDFSGRFNYDAAAMNAAGFMYNNAHGGPELEDNWGAFIAMSLLQL